MKKIIVIVIAIISVACACKKYEEGPLISFRSARSRLLGYHTLTKYTVNGIDSLSQFYDSLSLSLYFFYNDVYYDDLCCFTGDRRDGKGCVFVMSWELRDKNKILKIKTAGGASIGTGPFMNNITPEWTILKLMSKDIIMTTNYNNKEYKIELK